MSEKFIIVVDDERMVIDTIISQLRHKFGEAFIFEGCQSGERALALIKELNDEGMEIVLVISDQIMPEMKGDEFLIEVHKSNPQTIKILLTGQATQDAAINAVNNADLYRYIEKPWEKEDLILTLEKGIEKYALIEDLKKKNEELVEINQNQEKIISERTEKLQTALDDLKEKDQIIKQDLIMARKIQQSLFSNNSGLQGFQFVVNYYPLFEVGGDIYDIFRLSEDTIRVFIADATGHGVQAALTTMLIKSEYEKIKIFKLPVDKILESLNSVFVNQYYNLCFFFSCFIIDIDIKEKKMYFSSAGHPEQYLIKKDKIIEIQAEGKLIGINKNVLYQNKEISYVKGDKILLFTDGLFEEFDEKGLQLDEYGLKNIINKHQDKTINYLLLSIVNDVKNWIGSSSINDDMTLIGIQL